MSNKQYNLYITGGWVRDKLLGIKSKDIDYAFEFTKEFIDFSSHASIEWFYGAMNSALRQEGFEIFLESPEFLTTRARFPKGHVNEGLTADFVLCRKEVYKNPDSRHPEVSIGTLYDDLARRDAKVNAIAIDEDGNYIDPFGGIEDVKNKKLDTVNDPEVTFNEDYLRMLRFIRFYITKDFDFSSRVWDALSRVRYWENLHKHVSHERIREELFKMLKHDTLKTIRLLNYFDEACGIYDYILPNGMWLKPTVEK